MRVDIEKRRIDSYRRIAQQANKAAGKAPFKAHSDKYRKSIMQLNISAENKKKMLMRHLHELVISTFSADISRISRKNAIKAFRANTELIRHLIQKIKAINSYFEEDLLREIGIIKKSLLVRALKSQNPVRYLESKSRVLSQDYIAKIEHTVYELMGRIIIFDKKLLKGYKQKEVKIIKNEKFGINDLEKTLGIESELLETLEAKIPPPSRIKAKLFSKKVFSLWASMVLALLASLEAECKKEKIIFSEIKKDERLRKKIERKIKHVAEEKGRVLRIKHERAIAMKSTGKISDDYRQKFHEYVHAASL